MKVRKFEELIVWQKSIEIAVELYKHFDRHPDFGFTNQIKGRPFQFQTISLRVLKEILIKILIGFYILPKALRVKLNQC